MPQVKTSKFLPFSPAMKRLNISLILLVLAGTFIFGFSVLFLAFTAVISSLIMEIIFAYFRDKKIDEGWLMNPLVFVLLLPPTLPVWMAGVGAVFAAFFGKLVFGGYPKYVFNPAVVGIIFLTISFPQYMNTQWLNPLTDVVGTLTPLIRYNLGQDVLANYPLLDLFTGLTPGLIGEVSRGLIIILGLFLVVTKTIDWKAPLAFLVSFFGLSFLGFALGFENFNDPYLGLIVGTLLFASVFLITDKPTLPVNTTARFLYGFLLAFFTLLIRIYAAWPEGVIFALIVMNAIAPLLDSLVTGKPITTLTTAEVK